MNPPVGGSHESFLLFCRRTGGLRRRSGRGRSGSDSDRRVPSCPACLCPWRPLARDDVRERGDVIRSRSDDVRPGGEDVRPGGNDVRPGGDDIRPGGDDVRPGGDDVRPGGDDVRTGGEWTLGVASLFHAVWQSCVPHRRFGSNQLWREKQWWRHVHQHNNNNALYPGKGSVGAKRKGK